MGNGERLRGAQRRDRALPLGLAGRLHRALPLGLAGLLLGLTAAGCSTRPVSIKPDRALQAALAHPEVATWHAAHSAPQVLAGLNPAAAQGLQRFRPVAMVDLDRDGLLVRFDSALGPRPRRLEVLVDKESGSVLHVRAPQGF